jgi:hypothetical protein
MYRQIASAAAITALSLSAGVAASLPQMDAPVTRVGWVRMATSLDGSTTVVTLGSPMTGSIPGAVVEAFRVQHLVPAAVAASGTANLTYEPGRLAVAFVDGETWSFSVGQERTAAHIYVVAGLSHYWGETVSRSSEEVERELMLGGCASGPGCDSCASGGIGVESCTAPCEPGSSCSATCGDGYFACCNCPGSCRCCRGMVSLTRRH